MIFFHSKCQQWVMHTNVEYFLLHGISFLQTWGIKHRTKWLVWGGPMGWISYVMVYWGWNTQLKMYHWQSHQIICKRKWIWVSSHRYHRNQQNPKKHQLSIRSVPLVVGQQMSQTSEHRLDTERGHAVWLVYLVSKTHRLTATLLLIIIQAAVTYHIVDSIAVVV